MSCLKRSWLYMLSVTFSSSILAVDPAPPADTITVDIPDSFRTSTADLSSVKKPSLLREQHRAEFVRRVGLVPALYVPYESTSLSEIDNEYKGKLDLLEIDFKNAQESPVLSDSLVLSRKRSAMRRIIEMGRRHHIKKLSEASRGGLTKSNR